MTPSIPFRVCQANVKSPAVTTSSIMWVAIKRMSVRIEDDKAIDVKTRMASEIRARGAPSLEDSRGAESSTSTESFLGSVGGGMGLGGACADWSCADEDSAILKIKCSQCGRRISGDEQSRKLVAIYSRKECCCLVGLRLRLHCHFRTGSFAACEPFAHCCLGMENTMLADCEIPL